MRPNRAHTRGLRAILWNVRNVETELFVERAEFEQIAVPAGIWAKAIGKPTAMWSRSTHESE